MNTGEFVAEFELPDETGTLVRLSTLLERGPVVLFFYPAAMTTGCTAESCHFRDLRSEFEAFGATPVGISMDAVDRQHAFAERHGFGFPLLSDRAGVVAEQFGVRRSVFRFLPVRRTTFVIGTDRRVLGIIRSELRMDAHADRALAIVRDMASV
jgi:peroxiredoxin Q/BCP